MKKPIRLFNCLALLVGALTFTTAGAQSFQEGVDYERISGPDVSDDNSTVEVVEVFGYLCPHCRSFQPFVSSWEQQLPEQVEFSRLPVSFSPSWEPFARAYHTASSMDIIDQSHEALFVALHDERKQFGSMSDLAEFHAQFDVDAKEFESTSKSFAVESRMRMGNAQIGKWGVRSTPTLVINGKYRVSPQRGKTFEDMLKVADFVIAKELEANRSESADSES
ncbi:MAG: thiol:disulfide interchange protein DsbA/DsbL [Wenzhouxiangellaceae bacterium]|nr:thiol:disulfide interchange protein DsbA/DsbL [Wenzhouxiangellaceae bacterium]